MAATAAALSTYIQAREPANKLKQLTNFERSASATSIDTTVLEAFCTTAINTFESQYTTYDPDTIPAHYDVAWYMAMMLLQEMAGENGHADEYRKKATALIPGLQKRRTMQPVTDSTWVPTPRSSATPPFDDTFFTPFKAR